MTNHATMKSQIEQLEKSLPHLTIARAVPVAQGDGIMDITLAPRPNATPSDQIKSHLGAVRQAIADAGLVANGVTVFPGISGPPTDAYIIRGLRPDPDAAKPAPAAKPQPQPKG